MLKVILLICVLAFVSQEASSSEDVEGFLRELEEMMVDTLQHAEPGIGCECVQGVCECCGKYESRNKKQSNRACLYLEYNGENAEIEVAVKLDGNQIFSDSFSVKDVAKDFCVSLPNLGRKRLEAAACLDFYDVQVKPEYVQVCLRIMPKLRRKERPKMAVDLECLKLSKGGLIRKHARLL